MNKVVMINIHFIIVCISIICLALVTAELLPEKEPMPCVWEGAKGFCVRSRRCLTTLDRRAEKQPVCVEEIGAPKTEIPFICCTDCELVNDTSNFIISASGGAFWQDGRKSRDHCLQYLRDLPHVCHQEGFYGGITKMLNKEKQCHTYSLWGIGGAPPPGSEPPRANPYEALMGYGTDVESAVWMTAGAIISDKFILTSAHGHLTTEGELPLKFAALGVKNRKSDKRDWQIRHVKKIHQHPLYVIHTRYNDIALLELTSPIQFNKDVLPACLPDPDEEFDISTAKFSSWKLPTTQFSNFTDTANIVEVKELNTKECDEKITEAEQPIPIAYNKFLPMAVNGTTQLCYGDTHTCLNVIGAPIVVTTQISRCMNTVIGVYAYGDACAATVFTKVSQYIPWIENIVWPYYYGQS